MKNLSADAVIAQIDALTGNLTMVAKVFGCSRTTLYKFVESHPSVKAALESARDKMIDNVESKLYQKALEGEGWAVCFFLKTQGKRRGYVERTEHTGEDGQGIVFKVVYDN